VLANPRNNFAARGWRGWRGLAVAAGLAVGLAPALAEAAWNALIRPDPDTRQSRCLLVSDPVITEDGYDVTPVYLALDGAALRVVTESELDASFADLRLEVDAEPPITSNQIIHKKMILVFDQDLPQLIERFRAGKQATVHLRFWPTWPATQSFPVRFSLVGFSRAHDRFTQGCRPAG
jgi:hypothetical protein